MSKEIIRWERVNAQQLHNLGSPADKDYCRDICWTHGPVKIALSIPRGSPIRNLSILYNGNKGRLNNCSRIFFFDEPSAPSRAYLATSTPVTIFGYIHHLNVARALVNVGISLELEKHAYVPTHAAVVEFDSCAIVIIGPSKAGKSTLTHRIAKIAYDFGCGFRVLTDDWALLRFDQFGQLTAISPERFLSMREDMATDVTPVHTGKKVKEICIGAKRFLYNPIHYQTFQPTKFILLGENALCIEPDAGQHIRAKVKHAIQSCQMFPYTFSDLRERHILFWEQVFKKFPAWGSYSLADLDDYKLKKLLHNIKC